MHDDSVHSSDARRHFNIFLSLFGGLMAVAAILGSLAQAASRGGEVDPFPLIFFGAAALGLINIAAYLIYDEQNLSSKDNSVSETDELSIEAIGLHKGRYLDE